MTAATVTAALRQTPLYARHQLAGGRLVAFAGWEMPVQYQGIREEHLAVRRDVGMFDVSHMGQIETRGPDAADLLQRLLSNDIGSLAGGGAQYSLICREDGGILDDVFTYRLSPGRFLTVTNAGNHAKDLAWFKQHAADFDAEIIDRASDYAMLAVQGPRAARVVKELAGRDAPARMCSAERKLAGAKALVCRTGYTGEDGVELLIDAGNAPAVWDALLERGVTPCGLGARDTLRLEVCFHLYGNDMDEARNPIEAGLGWCCKETTGFIGSEAVRAVRETWPREKLVPFVVDGPGIARQGNPVVGGGVVTSGSYSPSLGVGIGLAYVPLPHALPGAHLEINVRGHLRPAIVKTKPLYGGTPSGQ
jgi:aminomethyltransferase